MNTPTLCQNPYAVSQSETYVPSIPAPQEVMAHTHTFSVFLFVL